MRVLGVDYGRRRIGLALSDPSGLLASPWQTIEAGRTPRASATTLANLVAAADEDEVGPLQVIVVGLPRRLNGEDNEQTAPARAFAAALEAATGATIHLQDERLSSHEAESRLALRERDWRARKSRLDAAAAAVILQDYLDAQPRPSFVSDAD
jgi:putative holliday junction resolvase